MSIFSEVRLLDIYCVNLGISRNVAREYQLRIIRRYLASSVGTRSGEMVDTISPSTYCTVAKHIYWASKRLKLCKLKWKV